MTVASVVFGSAISEHHPGAQARDRLNAAPASPVLIAAVRYALSAARRRGDGARESAERVLKRHVDRETYERKSEELRK